MLYRIKDWDEHFEINRTKEIKHLRWVPIPNKQDGDGYTELVTEHKNGPAHYAAWIACVLIASKCDPRGTLLRDGRSPHTPRSIARKSRLPVGIIREALKRVLAIGWMELIEIPQEGARIPQVPAQKGREGKGREEKGKTGKGRDASHPTSGLGSDNRRRTAEDKRTAIWEECLRRGKGEHEKAMEHLRIFSRFKDHTGAEDVSDLKGKWLNITYRKAVAETEQRDEQRKIIDEVLDA